MTVPDIARFYISQSTRLLALGACLITGGCGGRSKQAEHEAARNTIEKDVKAGREQSVRHAVGTGIKLSGGDGKGRPLWKISAKSAEYSGSGLEAASKNARLNDAEAELYRDGKLESSFRAKQIDLVRSEKVLRLTMSGDVRAHTSGPWTGKRGPVSLQAPHADVDINTRRIWAKQGAAMSQGTGASQVKVSAKEVQADTALRTTTMRNTVHAATTEGTLTADAATWNWESGRAQASGKVTATHDGTTISGERLDTDSRARRGVLRGGVKAVTAEGEATASQVHYDWGGGKIAASGGVRLQRDGGVLQAASIVTDDKLNGARASGGVTLQKDGATLRAAQVQAFDQMTRASASGNVTLTHGEVTMRANRVQAVNLNNDASTRISADGEVRLTQPELVVTASHAEAMGLANKSASRVVASGSVRFTQNGKTVTAARVEANGLNKDSAQVTATGGVRFTSLDMAVNAGRVQAAGFSGKLPARFVASGGVVARSDEATVRASRVQRENGRIVATGDVTLSKDGSTLSGERLESNDDFKNASLTGDVNAKLAEGGTIKAGVLRWQNAGGAQNWEGGRIFARDGVSMTRENIRLRGDKLDASANGGAAVLTGNVVVTTDEGVTLRAPTARYDKKTDKIYASGGVIYDNPKQDLHHQSKTLVFDRKTQTAYTTEGRTVTKMDLFEGKKLLGTNKRKTG